MPRFYHLPFVLFVSCTLSLFLLLVFFLIFRNRVHKLLVSSIGFFMFVFILLVLVINILTFKAQSLAAVPYIQEALNKYCGEHNIEANEGGFDVDSGYRWSSESNSVQCYYNNVEWSCTC